MKVTVEECPGLEQTEVTVRCKRMDSQVSRLVELLRLSSPLVRSKLPSA